MPAVSVIIPAYNREAFIERAVSSALSQTFPDMEVIVVDDGSSDGTARKIAALVRSDERVRYLRHEENRGAQAARNSGIREATGAFIAFLDSDNEWLPHKLERQMALFANCGERLGVVFAGYREISHDQSDQWEYIPRIKGEVYRAILEQSCIEMNTIIVRRDVIERAGLCDERIRAFQEWDLCIRLARCSEFDCVPEALVRYHRHSSPTISGDSARSAWGYADVVAAHREEILRLCGARTLSRHYLRVGHLFMLAGAVSRARGFFLLAREAAPFNMTAPMLYGISLLGSRGYGRVRAWKRSLLPPRESSTVSVKRI
jgi:glycosyltransferase involved in cell wall biosynthesis